MIIRRLEVGEGGVYGQIRLRSLVEDPTSFAALASDYDGFSDAEWEAFLARRTAFVAMHGAQPVGLASLVFMDLSRLEHRALVTNVFVAPEHRAKGIAGRLLDALEDHARALGIIQLELAVNVENTVSIALYEARGYKRFGQVPRGFKHADRYFDEILMVLPLDSGRDPA